MEKIIIDNIEYEIDSSGAIPEKEKDIFGSIIIWKLNGKVHRVDGPAAIYNDGSKEWIQNGLRHNLKGPAVIYSNGDQAWFINGKLIGDYTEEFTQEKFEKYLLKNHNIVMIDNQEYEVDSSGAKPEKYHNSICWRLNGEFHRVDGPAIIHNDGPKFWYQNGLLHNLKGPAFINSDGTQFWWINGELIGKSKEGFTQEKFEEYLNVGKQKENVKMSDIMNKVEKMAYRSAGRKLTKATKSAIKLALQSHMGSKEMEGFISFLETPIGGAALSTFIGTILPYAPGIGQDPRAIKLADEFQIEGGSVVIDSVSDSLMDTVQPLMLTLKSLISDLPPVSALKSKSTRARIDHLSDELEVEAEAEVENVISLGSTVKKAVKRAAIE